MRIFLDDIRNPLDCSGRWIYDVFYQAVTMFPYSPGSWTIVRSYDEFSTLLDSIDVSQIELVSLDHDLCEEHYKGMLSDHEVGYYDLLSYGPVKTGYHCTLLLKEKMNKYSFKPRILIHTMNSLACGKMKEVFDV